VSDVALKRVAVFCGSRDGAKPVFREAAQAFGTALAARGLELVYGGAQNGLMGALSDAVLAGGQRAIGVYPTGLARAEFVHPRLSEHQVVTTMHERKATMEKLSDAFVALPGGYGTMDELFETLSWAQLGLHRKPVGLLNVDGYYDALVEWTRRGLAEGFVPEELKSVLVVDADPGSLLDQLLAQPPPSFPVRWLK
jgi:uncharacterized protein (TIGR00730 family)